jgi:hypothetical protein
MYNAFFLFLSIGTRNGGSFKFLSNTLLKGLHKYIASYFINVIEQ